MNYEAHSNDFNRCLNYEYDREDQVNLIKNLVPVRFIAYIIIAFILFRSNKNGVQDDAKCNEAVEPLVDHDFHNRLPQFVCLVETVQTVDRVLVYLATDNKHAIKLPGHFCFGSIICTRCAQIDYILPILF